MAKTADRVEQRLRYERQWAALKLERSRFDFDWRDLADHFDPSTIRLYLTDRNQNRPRSRMTRIMDNTATFAVETLQSGLHAGLTSPARPWFVLTTPNPALTKRKAVQQWLFDATERLLSVFALSNLYTELPILYGAMGIFGTAAMSALEDEETLVRFFSYPIGSYVLDVDSKRRVNTFMREYRMTVAMLVEEFGGEGGQRLAPGADPVWTNFSPRIKTLWSRGQYQTPVDVYWAVVPNREPDDAALGVRAFPWISVHYERDQNYSMGMEGGEGSILREAGFSEFPILAPRWFVNSEDTYATKCPGITALGDVRQLQLMTKRESQAIEKQMNPSLIAPTSLRTQQVSFLPGGVTYADVREGQQGIKPIYEVRPDLAAFEQVLSNVRNRIDQAFYVDIFRMLSALDEQRGAQPPTAREIDERHEEKMLMLGPVVTRTKDDLIQPLIMRTLGIMARRGFLPPKPPELKGVDLIAEPISVLAQAQRLTKIPPLDSLVQRVGGMLSVAPQAADKINWNAVVEEYANVFGVNPALILSDEEAAALTQAKQQAAAQQAAAERIAKIGAGAKALAQAPMNNDSALGQLMETVQ